MSSNEQPPPNFQHPDYRYLNPVYQQQGTQVTGQNNMPPPGPGIHFAPHGPYPPGMARTVPPRYPDQPGMVHPNEPPPPWGYHGPGPGPYPGPYPPGSDDGYEVPVSKRPPRPQSGQRSPKQSPRVPEETIYHKIRDEDVTDEKHQIIIRNLPEVCMDKEMLADYFESKRNFKNPSLTVKEVYIDKKKKHAIVTLTDKRAVDAVLQKKSGTLLKHKLHFERKIDGSSTDDSESESDDPSDDEEEEQEEEEEEEMVKCSKAGDGQYRTIQVKGFKPSTSEDTLRYFCENKKRSGGGEVEHVTMDETYAVITFQNAHDAEQVCKNKELKLDGNRLTATPYIVSNTEFLFKNLPDDLTEDNFRNFIEAKLKQEAGQICFNENKTKVLAQFSRNMDFQKVTEVCRKYKLKGQILVPQQVPVSHCIIITNIPDGVSDDSFIYFFESKKHGGAEVETVDLRTEEGNCLVYFKDAEGIQAVFDKQPHTMSGQKLKLSPYQPLLGTPLDEEMQANFTIPEPLVIDEIDKDMQKFLRKARDALSALTEKLKACHATLDLGPPIQLRCTLTAKAKGFRALVKHWKSTTQETFNGFLDYLLVKKESFEEDEWPEVLSVLESMNIEEADKLIVSCEKQVRKVAVIGFKDAVMRAWPRFVTVFNEMKQEVLAKKKRVMETKDLKPWQTFYLVRLRFLENIESEHDNLNVQLSTKDHKVTFNGPANHVTTAQQQMYETLNEAKKRTLHQLSKPEIELLGNKEASRYIRGVMRKQNDWDVWEVRNEVVQLYCDTDQGLTTMENTIRNSLRKYCVKLDDKIRKTIASNEWKRAKEDLKRKFSGGIVFSNTGDELEVLTTQDKFDEIQEEMKMFIDEHTTYSEDLQFDQHVVRFLQKHRKDEILAKTQSIGGLQVKFGQGDKIYVEGTRDGIETVKKFIRVLKHKVLQRDHTLTQPGVRRYLGNRKGTECLQTIERNYHCVIEVKPSSHFSDSQDHSFKGAQHGASPSPHAVKPQSKSGQVQIALVKGELAKQRVDVIVNSTSRDLQLDRGRSSKALSVAAGPQLQASCNQHQGELENGTMLVTGGFNLQCQNVFHIAISRYRGSMRELKQVVENCLGEAKKRGLSSIAFPALGTGDQKYPKDKVASEMFSSVSKFCQGNPGSLTTVKFIIYHADDDIYEAFCREENCWRGANNSDSEPSGDEMAVGVGSVVRQERDKVELNIKSLSILVHQGDITGQTTDGIVASGNRDLDLSKGLVTRAIVDKGGPSIPQECKKQVDRMRREGLAVTGAGNLNCKHIIFVDTHKNPWAWKKPVTECLMKAEEYKMTSLAFPALGTSVGCSAKDMGKVMCSAIAGLQRPLKYLRNVRIVIFQREHISDFIQSITTAVKGGYSAGTRDRRERPGCHIDTQESVIITLYSDNEKNIRDAVKGLEKIIKDDWLNKNFQDEVICNLNHYQVAQIKQTAQKHNCHVTINQKDGVIRIQGLTADYTNVIEHVNQVLRNLDRSRHEMEHAKLVKNMVRWYYLKDNKQYPFPERENMHIEAAFKDKKPKVQVKDRSGGEYEVDLKNMCEYNLKNPKENFPVVRRDLIADTKVEVPKHWKHMSDQQNVVEVDLSTTDQEYQNVVTEFTQSLGRKPNIIKVQRIQNVTLFTQYKAKKHQMKQQNSKIKNERVLWHGTSKDAIPSIVHHGFNRSYCGKNGTAIGNGVYFAVQASYSDGGYAAPDSSGHKRMFRTLVLTGETCQGGHGMRVPPAKSGSQSHVLYDSVTDNPSGPSMFVVFNDTQAYPEHLITYQ